MSRKNKAIGPFSEDNLELIILTGWDLNSVIKKRPISHLFNAWLFLFKWPNKTCYSFLTKNGGD